MIATRLILVLAILNTTVAFSQTDLPLMSTAEMGRQYVWIAKDIQHDNIAAQTGLFEDKTSRLQPTEVLLQPFAPMPDKNWMDKRKANILSCIWLKFSVDNSAVTDTLRLVFFPGMHARTTLYEVKNDTVEWRAIGGLLAAQPAFSWQANTNCLPLIVLPGSRSEYLVSVKNFFTTRIVDQVRAELFLPEAYRNYCQTYKERQLPFLLFTGFVIGGLLILVLFACMQFLLTRGLAYFWYAMFALGNAFNFARILEMYADVRWVSGIIPLFQGYTSLPATSFFYLLFVRYFLNFHTQNTAKSKLLTGAIWLFGFVFLSTTVIGAFYFSSNETNALLALLLLVFYIFLIFPGIIVLYVARSVKGGLSHFITTGTLLLLVASIYAVILPAIGAGKPLHEQSPFDNIYWGYGIFILLESLCFALGLGYKTKILEIEKREAILEQERQRIQISSDLHDEMGSTLSSISILSETALRDLQQDMDRARFGTIGERARQMIDAMSDIVWSVNPQNDTMTNVLQRMKEFAVEILEPQGIALHFEADEAVKNLTLSMEHRKDFYLLFKEAVNNAAKYSGASDVWVLVRTEQNKLYLEVRDNGRGFDASAAKPGNGLSNMRRRVERLGGVVSLESATGAGTSIKVDLDIP